MNARETKGLKRAAQERSMATGTGGGNRRRRRSSAPTASILVPMNGPAWWERIARYHMETDMKLGGRWICKCDACKEARGGLR